jgi:hypothetical protein
VTIQKRQEGCLASIARPHRFEIHLENTSEIQRGRVVASIDQIAKRLRDWKHYADKRPKRNWVSSEINPAKNSTDFVLEALRYLPERLHIGPNRPGMASSPTHHPPRLRPLPEDGALH